MTVTRYVSPAVERAFAILEALAEAREMGLSELARALRLGKSSVYRLLNTLVSTGYVEKRPDSGRYRLTYRLSLLAGAASERSGLADAAAPVLRRLAAETAESANLGVLEGGVVVNLLRVEGPQPLRLHLALPGGVPPHATGLGKVLLAALGPAELRARLGSAPLARLTPRTIRDRRTLRAELERVGRLGYAVDDEECSLGLRCVAAPVRDRSGEVIAAVSIAAPAHRLPREHVPEVARTVTLAGRELSRRLGHGEWRARA